MVEDKSYKRLLAFFAMLYYLAAICSATMLTLAIGAKEWLDALLDVLIAGVSSLGTYYFIKEYAEECYRDEVRGGLVKVLNDYVDSWILELSEKDLCALENKIKKARKKHEDSDKE